MVAESDKIRPNHALPFTPPFKPWEEAIRKAGERQAQGCLLLGNSQ